MTQENKQRLPITLVDIELPGIRRDTEDLESLSKEWDKQSKDMTRRFAEKLGFSKEDYPHTLPKFGTMPESFKNFGVPPFPLVVDPRVPLPDLLTSDLELAKSRQHRGDLENLSINIFFDLEDLADWKEGCFQTPSEPYAIWLTYIPNTSVEEIRNFLMGSKDIRGGTMLDSIFLYYNKPQILNNFKLDLPGSQVYSRDDGSNDVPFLSALSNSEGRPFYPSLNRGAVDTTSRKFACLIASKIG